MQSRAVEADVATLARSSPQERERVERVPLLSGGIHTEKAPNELAPNEVVECLGLHLVAGRLVVDTGYVPFSHEYDGIAQLPFQALFADGTSVELLVTSTTVYRYASEIPQWQLVSLNAVRLTTAPAAGGDQALDLDDVSDIAAGTVIGVILDDGTQFVSFAQGPPVGNTITLDAPLPVGSTVALGNEVAVGVELHGDPTISQVSAVLFPGNEWIIFSNGIDPIMYYYQGVVTELAGLPTNTTCATMAVFHSMLFIGNTTENGTHLPGRVRQSDLADPEGWTPGVDGIAAIYDLLDTPDYIFALKTLGPWLICYRAASVMRASFIGALNEIVYWEYMSQQDGIQSQGAVADVGAAHILIGTNNVYAYTGDYTLPPIGEPVFQNFLARDGDLYAPAKATIFTVYVPALREVWIFYPSSEVAPAPDYPTYPNKTLRYNVALRSWQTREFADLFVAAGMYLPQSITTWATAPGLWNDVIWARPWNSRLNVQNIPNVFLCPAAAQQLYVYEFAAQTDAGAVIEFELVTRQYGDGGEFTRWERVDFTGTGGATVETSQDEGVTWLPLGTLALGTTPSVQTLWIDTTSSRLQFRIAGTDSAFALRYASVACEFDSEW